jgi:hypothetical protein
MFSTHDAEYYRERAEAHEALAASTGDAAARQMHHAMAAEFRKRAAEAPVIEIVEEDRAEIQPRIALGAR